MRHAADGEKIVTLDGKERTLNSRNLVIADAVRPVVVAGIMGAGRSWTAWMISVVSIPCRYEEVISRSA